MRGVFSLEFAVQPAREDRDRPAIGVVGGVVDELIIGGEGHALADRIGVIGFENLLRTIVQLAITDQQAEAAGGEEVAMRLRQSVDRTADANGVVASSPIAALDGKPAGQAAIDVSERQDLVLAIIPARAREQADVLG